MKLERFEHIHIVGKEDDQIDILFEVNFDAEYQDADTINIVSKGKITLGHLKDGNEVAYFEGGITSIASNDLSIQDQIDIAPLPDAERSTLEDHYCFSDFSAYMKKEVGEFEAARTEREVAHRITEFMEEKTDIIEALIAA